ncbi:MAG: hypothetical protein KGI80_03960 [Verrucomicrobiota bacterium]|nr:hypothetical protein [Verrucomicrobiota bacterium]
MSSITHITDNQIAASMAAKNSKLEETLAAQMIHELNELLTEFTTATSGKATGDTPNQGMSPGTNSSLDNMLSGVK